MLGPHSDADGDLDIFIGNGNQPSVLYVYTHCPDRAAQVHATSACFECPAFMGRPHPSMCLECTPDFISAGTRGGTGEEICGTPEGNKAFSCVRGQRPLGSDQCQECANIPGTYYQSVHRDPHDPATWTTPPTCADCQAGWYALDGTCVPCSARLQLKPTPPPRTSPGVAQ